MTVKALKLVGDWKKSKEVLAAAPADLEQAVHKAVIGLANYLAGRIKRKISSNIAPANSPFTVMMKKSSKTLIEKGDLRNSVTVIQGGRHEAFIGIPQAGGAADLASVLEKGRTIVMRMTPKMLAYLHATLGSKASKIPSKGPSTGVLVIHIPARPFMEPTFAEEESKVEKKFEALVLSNLQAMRPPSPPSAGDGAVGSDTPRAGQKLVWVKHKSGGMVRRWVNT